MITSASQWLADLLHRSGIPTEFTHWIVAACLFIATLLLSYLCFWIFRRFFIPGIRKITLKTNTKFDDYLFNEKILRSFSHLILPIVVYVFLPAILGEVSQSVLNILMKAAIIYMVVCTLRLIGTIINSLYDLSNENSTLKTHTLKGIFQMVHIIAIGVGIILIISILLGKEASSILTGLGASAAILMLVFKDSILGLVAGVKLSINDMLRPGDWITMPKYSADGDVIEVNLTTVKVQNFDKTITTIPPYALVSDSFQNWRGMCETGGRRIKRSLFIDVFSIHFATEQELEHFRAKGWITEDDEKPVNLQVFKNYVENYLKNHAGIHKGLTVMVRQLQPTPEGLPLEIYCFTNTTVWKEYEEIQSRIFNHIIAMMPEFNLRLFQRRSGGDPDNTLQPTK